MKSTTQTLADIKLEPVVRPSKGASSLTHNTVMEITKQRTNTNGAFYVSMEMNFEDVLKRMSGLKMP